MYTCEICTSCIDESKREEILRNVARIITEALKKAPSGTGLPSGANQNYNNLNISQKREYVKCGSR